MGGAFYCVEVATEFNKPGYTVATTISRRSLLSNQACFGLNIELLIEKLAILLILPLFYSASCCYLGAALNRLRVKVNLLSESAN